MALVPARLLGDTVKSLSDAPVEFETDQSPGSYPLCCIRRIAAAAAGGGFPRRCRSRAARGSEAEAGVFAEAVSQVGRAASRDEARPVLTGVLVEISREGCVLVATDSYRLAVRELVATADGEAKAIVPERALAEAGRAAAADEKGMVEISVDDAQVSFKAGGLTLTSRLIEGEFPNYRAAAAGHAREPADGIATAVTGCGATCGLLARDTTPVRMEFNALGVKLSIQLARPRPSRRDGRGALRGRGSDGRVQPAVPDRRADRVGGRVDPARRSRRAEAGVVHGDGTGSRTS